MNILITRHDKIGDFILTLPMIKIAFDELSDDKIYVLCSKVNYEFAKKISFIDEVILYEDDIFSMVKKIKKFKIDISFSAFIDTKLAIILYLSGIKTRVAPATKFAQFFFNNTIKQRRSRVEKKEFEYNIDLLKAYKKDLNYKFKKPLIDFTKSQKNKILDEFMRKFNVNKFARLVGFHVGFGGSSDGNLTLDDYIKLAKSISKNENIQIVFTFGPDDKKNLKYIEKKINFNAICFESNLSLMDFCIFLSNFYLFVSTSTGPMHLAALTNVKTLSFFGDSLFASDKRWGSINEVDRQNNFCIKENYGEKTYNMIEKRLKEIIDER